MDITQKVERGGIGIKPDGEKMSLIDTKIFRHFGIPDLPEKKCFEELYR